MLFDNYAILVEFVDEYSIDTLYDYINYIEDVLNHSDISFIKSDAISIMGINTFDDAETIINKLKNLYLPDFKIYGYKAFKILHTVAITSAIAALVKENNELKEKNKNMETVIKNDRNYISELEDKVKGLEAANEKLLIQDRVHNGVIYLSSELSTKVDNQSKEITRLLNNQEKLKAEIANKEQIISSLEINCNMLSKKVNEFNKGIRNSADLTWKEKYNNLKKKCVNNQYGVASNARDGYISELEEENKKLKAINQALKKESETYRIKFIKAECAHNKAEENLSKIHDLIHGKE